MQIIFGLFLFILVLCLGRVVFLLSKTKKPAQTFKVQETSKSWVETKAPITVAIVEEAAKQITTNSYNFEQLGDIVREEAQKRQQPSVEQQIRTKLQQAVLQQVATNPVISHRDLSNWELDKLTTEQLTQYLSNKQTKTRRW